MGKEASETLGAVDPKAILDEKISVSQGDATRKISPVEAGYRNLLSRALKGDMNAIKRLTNECINLGILSQQIQEPYSPSVLHIPKHWDSNEWYSNIEKRSYPPWPGEDDGFTVEDRAEYKYWRKHGHHSWRDGS